MAPPSRSRTATIVVSVTLSTALALVGNLATNAVDVTGWWGLLAWAAVGVLVVVAVVVRRRSALIEADGGVTADGIDAAAYRLAEEVCRQWKNEAALRGIFRPLPLRVRWSSTGRPVAASREVVMNAPVGADWHELPLHGDLEEIVAAYRSLPHGQLVVLGDPGAGKSVLAMLLTVKLIEQSQAGEPIPVLLQAASGNLIDGIEAFVVRRLLEEYQFLARRGEDGRTHAERLVAQGLILPVFDGLDELPVAWHAEAVRVLDRLASAGWPFVVVCRGREYEQAVTGSGLLLSQAAVIEIEPIGIAQIVEFLTHPPSARSRWQPVFEHLRLNPGGALARVLATPLMVALARTAYQDPVTRPQELLGLRDGESIQRRLMNAFIDGAYESELPSPLPGEIKVARRGDYRPVQAAHYLGCLAYHLYQAGTRDLCWWQLTSDVMSVRPDRTRFMVPILSAVAAILATRLSVSLLLGPNKGNAVALLVLSIVFVGLFRSMWPHGYPPYIAPGVRFTRSERVHRALAALGFGAIFGLITGLLLNDVPLGLACGLVCGLLAILIPAWPLTIHVHRPTPRMTVAHNHRNALTAAIQYGFIGGVIFTLGASISPGAPTAWAAGLIAMATYGVSAACGAGLGTWMWFRLNHILLVVRGWLPVRFWSFLDDAYVRGALRQAGLAWQFRHALFQDHLVPRVHQRLLESRVQAGDVAAANQLSDLLAVQGRFDLVSARAEAGDRIAADKLPDLLTRFGKVDEAIQLLETRADSGDLHAARRLAALLAAHGRVDELRTRAEAGDDAAADELSYFPGDHDQGNEIVARLQEHAGSGNWRATRSLARLLVRYGRAADAITVLRDHADAGSRMAAEQLVEVLVSDGRVNDAFLIVGELSVSGDEQAQDQLPGLLIALGRIDDAVAELQASAAVGDLDATRRLGELLVTQNRIAEAIPALQTCVDAGDLRAAHRLEGLFIKQGRREEAIRMWRVLAKAGDLASTYRLVALLAQDGRVDPALDILRAVARAGRWGAADQLAEMLTKNGHIDELRARADSGDRSATLRHASVLAKRGRSDLAMAVLRARADSGDLGAVYRLADLFVEQGRPQEAIAFLRVRVDASEWGAVLKLAELLIGQDRIEEAITVLRVHVDDGDNDVVIQLADLLATTGRTDEAIGILRTYSRDRHVAAYLCNLLAMNGRLDDLHTSADAGDEQAAIRLARLYAEQNRIEEAKATLRTHAASGDWEAVLQLARLHTSRNYNALPT